MFFQLNFNETFFRSNIYLYATVYIKYTQFVKWPGEFDICILGKNCHKADCVNKQFDMVNTSFKNRNRFDLKRNANAPPPSECFYHCIHRGFQIEFRFLSHQGVPEARYMYRPSWNVWMCVQRYPALCRQTKTSQVKLSCTTNESKWHFSAQKKLHPTFIFFHFFCEKDYKYWWNKNTYLSKYVKQISIPSVASHLHLVK